MTTNIVNSHKTITSFPELLYDQSPVGNIVLRHDGMIVHSNKTLLSWLELEAGEDINGESFFNFLLRSGKLYFQMFLLPLLQMQGNVSEISMEIVPVSKNSFPCLFYAQSITCDSEEKMFQVTIIRIGDRKKFEAQLIKEKQTADEGIKRLEFLANSIANLLFTIGADGYINFVNKRFSDYFNLAPNSYQQFVFNKRVHPDDIAAVSQAWKTCFAEIKTFNAEARFINAQNNYEWFMVSIVPYTNESGKVELWFGSCTNIHQQKEKQLSIVNHLNTNLSAATNIIERNEESFRKIAFEQSHIVRMPLANILGLINLIESLEMADELRDLFIMLSESALKLDEAIRSIVNKTYEDSPPCSSPC